jgi:S-DNA-T family DNA segregation ATPase FtsK/SpoIIIE
VKLAAARHGHAAAYHGIRAPGYLVLTAWWALVGIGRTVSLLLSWWHVPDLHKLEHQAAADGLLSDHLRIHKAGKDTRTARGLILAGCAVVVVAALVILSRAPVWAWVLVAAATGPLLARAGRPAHKPIVTAATLPATVQAPSQDVITRALGSLGIAGIDRWIRDGRALVFPSPVREDGPGWRAEVDLPYGVTAAMVMDRREQLASGLRRPLGAVWPEPVTSEHAGRLELWVGRQDVAKSKQAPGRASEAHLRQRPPGEYSKGREDSSGAGPGLRRCAGPAGGDVGARAQGLR